MSKQLELTSSWVEIKNASFALISLQNILHMKIVYTVLCAGRAINAIEVFCSLFWFTCISFLDCDHSSPCLEF
jgi:hypothetical protein